MAQTFAWLLGKLQVPFGMFSFQPPLLWPKACIYSVLEEVIQFQHQWDTPSFGWGSSSLDGISSSIIGMHEPSGGAQIN